MKISHFLAQICHFGGHFEFLKFSGIKRHRRSNILKDSCSTPNLAMETTCFIPDLQKKFRYAQPYDTTNHAALTLLCSLYKSTLYYPFVNAWLPPLPQWWTLQSNHFSPAQTFFFFQISGGFMVPSVTISQVVSAVICRRFKLNSKQCCAFILICHISSGIFMAMNLFIGCNNSPLAGINTPYSMDPFNTDSPDVLTTTQK